MIDQQNFPEYLGTNIIDTQDVPLLSQYIFGLFDKNDTGMLSRGEILEIDKRLGMMSLFGGNAYTPDQSELEKVEDLIKILDVDQDGKVTCQDFESFIYKYMQASNTLTNVHKDTTYSPVDLNSP